MDLVISDARMLRPPFEQSKQRHTDLCLRIVDPGSCIANVDDECVCRVMRTLPSTNALVVYFFKKSFFSNMKCGIILLIIRTL